MSIKTSFKAAKIAVSSKTGRQVLRVQKNSPHILFAVGVVGVVGTAVLSSKATLHLDRVLDDSAKQREMALEMLESEKHPYTQKHYDSDIKVMKIRLAKDIVWMYTPAVVCGIATIGCFTGSHVILNRRYTGAVAAYAALDRAFAQYREKVIELVGPEKERELRYEMIEREIAVDGENGVEIQTIKEVSGISQYGKLFSRETSTAWEKEPNYRLVFLRSQQAWANDRLQSRGHVFLNDVYRDLGFEDTTAGAVVGWVKDNPSGDGYIDFGIFTDKRAEEFNDFMTTKDGALWLDFNVDGMVYELIDKKKQV